jgi:hypothetical protein
MAGWEKELTELLGELGVTQEEPKTPLRSPRHSDIKFHNFPVCRDVKRQELTADALFLDEMVDDDDNDDAWLTDLSLMRREVDSIVSQVIRLMQRGDLDKSLKEDVMVVLRALRRRAAVTQQAAASDEAYLEFAAAMLHFCRIVLRLSEPAAEDL